MALPETSAEANNAEETQTYPERPLDYALNIRCRGTPRVTNSTNESQGNNHQVNTGQRQMSAVGDNGIDLNNTSVPNARVDATTHNINISVYGGSPVIAGGQNNRVRYVSVADGRAITPIPSEVQGRCALIAVSVSVLTVLLLFLTFAMISMMVMVVVVYCDGDCFSGDVNFKKIA